MYSQETSYVFFIEIQTTTKKQKYLFRKKCWLTRWFMGFFFIVNVTNSHGGHVFSCRLFSNLDGMDFTSNSIYGSTKLLSLSSHAYSFFAETHILRSWNQVYICETGSNQLMNYYFHNFFSHHVSSIIARKMVGSAKKIRFSTCVIANLI